MPFLLSMVAVLVGLCVKAFNSGVTWLHELVVVFGSLANIFGI